MNYITPEWVTPLSGSKHISNSSSSFFFLSYNNLQLQCPLKLKDVFLWLFKHIQAAKFHPFELQLTHMTSHSKSFDNNHPGDDARNCVQCSRELPNILPTRRRSITYLRNFVGISVSPSTFGINKCSCSHDLSLASCQRSPYRVRFPIKRHYKD